MTLPWTSGGSPYAIGELNKGRFRVRCIRFGKLAASYERRPDEVIRVVSLTVSAKPCKPIAPPAQPPSSTDVDLPW
jgi:hypothetical protein